MANNLDLEEQEQLAELKHFWNQYGNLISWTLIVVFGAIAAWNGWQYWQRTQSVQAAALFDEVDRASAQAETARAERAFADIKEKFPRTAFAHQAGLLTAKVLAEKGNSEGAKAALAWVAENAGDDGYKAVARLRLVALLVEAKAYDDALKQLAADFPPEYEGLAQDRRGDVYSLQGKKAEAKAEYLKAYKALDAASDLRRVVEVKLTALGVDVRELAPAPAAAASGAAKT
ncbi:YfgM family protein [Ramlibacter sp. PS4R-6]|uniref:YfgM family protein n=1 Tax=Ramlibacter sp. PS4R-6 TaxID=3133438 RepID=UPI0030B5E14A